MWKPGDPAPLSLSGSKRKKKNKRGGRNKKSPNNASVSSPGSPSKNEARKQENGEKDFNKVPSLYSEAPVVSSNAKRGKVKVSAALSKLKFMSRKQDAREQQQKEREMKRKADQEKWVITKEQLDGTDNTQLMCIPLETNPAVRIYTTSNNTTSRFSGRRSFGNFNKKVDDFNHNLELNEEDKKVAEYVDENAIDKEEMAEFFGSKNKKTQNQHDNKKGKKRKARS